MICKRFEIPAARKLFQFHGRIFIFYETYAVHTLTFLSVTALCDRTIFITPDKDYRYKTFQTLDNINLYVVTNTRSVVAFWCMLLILISSILATLLKNHLDLLNGFIFNRYRHS